MGFGDKIDNQITTGFNTDSVGSATDSFDTTALNFISYAVIAETGNHASHRCVLKCSPNGTDWFEMPDSNVTGEGAAHNLQCTFRYAKVEVKTAEGSTSRVKIEIQAK